MGVRDTRRVFVDLGADFDGEGEEVECGVDFEGEGKAWTVFEATDSRAYIKWWVDEE
jgi:hypothetical protein